VSNFSTRTEELTLLLLLLLLLFSRSYNVSTSSCTHFTIFSNFLFFSMSRGLACYINPQPGGQGDFLSRFSSSSPWHASIKLQGSSANFGHPGYFISPVPAYLVNIPLAVTGGCARWKTGNSSTDEHTWRSWKSVFEISRTRLNQTKWQHYSR